MDFSLKDKVAVITGGSRGIGKATALAFAEVGAHVVIASRKIEDLELVAAEINNRGQESLAIATHMGRMEDIYNLVEKVKDKFGRIDILVNNAGGSPIFNPLLDADEKLWNVVVNLNLKGLLFLSLEVAKSMKEQGGGSIINVSSANGMMPEEGLGVYCIAKAGVNMATKAMALEWAKHNIRVNCICPGQINTKLGSYIFDFPDMAKAMIERTPQKRLGEPQELVGAMIWLASNASSFVTGAIIPVDGGITLV